MNDYKINLFEIAWLTDEQVAGFKSDFRIVADYFVQMRKNGTYKGPVSSVRHMREVLQLLSELTDDDRFLKIIEVKEGDEPKNMSEALDLIEKRGIEQGKINQAKKDAFRMKKKGFSIEDIADIVEQDVSIVSMWIQNMSAGNE